MISRPIINTNDIWARNAGSGNILQPPQERFIHGWTYEDKPSFQEWNWYVNLNTQFINHLNENGVPEYDQSTNYQGTSFVKYRDQNDNDFIYQGLSHNLDEPSLTDRRWTSFELLKYIEDINVDLVKNNEVLFYYKEVWINAKITSYPLISYFGTDTNTFTDYEGENFKDNSGSLKGIELKNDKKILWYDKDLKIFEPKEITELKDFENFDYNNIKNHEIQNIQENDIIYYDYDTKTWKNKNITELPVNLKDIECTPSTENEYGGLKMWVQNGDLFIEN